MVYVAVMGYGTIGSGVAEILDQNRTEIAKGAGEEAALKYVLDLRDFPDSPVADKVIHDFNILLEDPEVSVVAETMGGLDPAYPFVKACLEAGKHVVSSNKALVAAHGTELLQIARDRGVNFLFEASVGGGIPIIRPLYRCLKGERIAEITGILNGTTNYILTRMGREGASFDAVLKEAQELGYAERNPEDDVEGFDTCRKLAILTAMATGKEVNYEHIHTEGITRITDVDFRYAEKMNMSVKLLGFSRIGAEVHAWVAPVMIGKSHPLHAVSDVLNGILVKGNMLGISMYYGSGAGRLPTASAVVADMIEAVENKDQNVKLGWTAECQEIAGMETTVHRYFVRVAGAASEKAEMVRKAFGEVEMMELDGLEEFAALTGKFREGEFQKAAAGLDAACRAAGGEGILQMIRVGL